LSDTSLCKAVDEMARGLIDADLGGGLFKKRVALPGRGKRGSARTLVASNRGSRWFFVFGFEKNERSNISSKEKEALQCFAKDLLARIEDEIDTLVQIKELVEVHDDEEKK